MQKDCSVIILAAGNSTRMGQLKFTLTLEDGTTFIENIVKQYAEFGCSEIIVVVNINGKEYLEKHPLEGITVAVNKHPEFERFYSIKTGLSKIKSNNPVFIHNSDNPYANQIVLKVLFTSREDADFIKPVFEGKGGHPILISYKIVKKLILHDDQKIHLNEFLKNYSFIGIEVKNDKILININTKEEYLNL